MSDSKQITQIALIDGPHSGTYGPELLAWGKNGEIRIPVDEHFIINVEKPFAFAVYEPTDIPSDTIRTFGFKKFVKAEDGPFLVEFVGGPKAGMHPMSQPVLGLLPIVMIPVKNEPSKDTQGRQRVFAFYKNGAFWGGEHKLIFEREMRDVVTTQRIIFELTGGPFDGVTYDSDAGMLERHSEFRANAFYTVTNKGEIGKRCMIIADHAWNMLEELGPEITDKIGPFPPHVYEVFERIEEPYEVYVRAKYIGIATDYNN
jgi:hypothetical protein